MPDWNKVIKGLEVCTGSFHKHSCSECPYYNDCERKPNRPKHFLLIDVLALLKAQEPIKPVLKRFKLGFHTDAVRIEPCCGGCGHKLETWYKHCPECGRAVKLDGLFGEGD